MGVREGALYCVPLNVKSSNMQCLLVKKVWHRLDDFNQSTPIRDPCHLKRQSWSLIESACPRLTPS